MILTQLRLWRAGKHQPIRNQEPMKESGRREPQELTMREHILPNRATGRRMGSVQH